MFKRVSSWKGNRGAEGTWSDSRGDDSLEDDSLSSEVGTIEARQFGGNISCSAPGRHLFRDPHPAPLGPQCVLWSRGDQQVASNHSKIERVEHLFNIEMIQQRATIGVKRSPERDDEQILPKRPRLIENTPCLSRGKSGQQASFTSLPDQLYDVLYQYIPSK